MKNVWDDISDLQTAISVFLLLDSKTDFFMTSCNYLGTTFKIYVQYASKYQHRQGLITHTCLRLQQNRTLCRINQILKLDRVDPSIKLLLYK